MKNDFEKSNNNRQDFSSYLPVNKVVNGEVYFEKKNNKFKTIKYNLNGFNQDGFNRKGFEKNGLNLNGNDEHGLKRNKELASEEKVKHSIRENLWNNCHASAEFRNKYENMLKCVEADPNTYQFATLHLRNKNIDLFFYR